MVILFVTFKCHFFRAQASSEFSKPLVNTDVSLDQFKISVSLSDKEMIFYSGQWHRILVLPCDDHTMLTWYTLCLNILHSFAVGGDSVLFVDLWCSQKVSHKTLLNWRWLRNVLSFSRTYPMLVLVWFQFINEYKCIFMKDGDISMLTCPWLRYQTKYKEIVNTATWNIIKYSGSLPNGHLEFP